MSSGSVEHIIILGGPQLANQYTYVSCLALVIYEYLLTLGDEVRLYFSRPATAVNRAPAGFLFFVTRYFVPICLSVITAGTCKIVGPVEPGFWTVIVIASGILLLLRVYALYSRNKWTLGYLSSVIVIQFAVSIFVFTFRGHGRKFRQIDLPVFQGCLFLPSASLNNGALAPVILELMYDVSIVALIIAKSCEDRSLNGLRDRGAILRIIVKDGIIYFLVIFFTILIWLCGLGFFVGPGLRLVSSRQTDGSANSLVSIMINRFTIHLHRSVKSNHGTSLTPSAHDDKAIIACHVNAVLTWMINTQDYSSRSDIDNAVISDLGDLALFHESQGIELEKFHP
ncbi:hypothetical protein JB92DRAFT_2907582 [Gautieria morchelliformis]|nr:hypothetical protein JB92DRAFT_2907582 [Gautieria morchelliformis]